MSAASTHAPDLEPGPISSTVSPAPSGRRWPEGSRGALVHGLALNVILPVCGIGFVLLLRPLLPPPESHWYDGSPGAFVLQGVRAALGVGLFLYVGLLVIGRLGWRDLGWRDLSPGQVALGCAGFVATAAVFGAYLAVAADMAPRELLDAIAGTSGRERLLGLLIGITASIVEESLFRGYLQPSLCKRLGTAGGVVATAVLFALMHVPRTLVSFGGRFVIGLCLGALRGRDRPLWAPAIVHTLIWIVIGAP